MAAAVRLIVTDNSTAASTMADRIAQGKARRSAVYTVPVFHVDDVADPSVVIGLGGVLFSPTGDPPRWEPARRAPARALRWLAATATDVVLATSDPLMDQQARDVVCESRPDLMRGVRATGPTLEDLHHLDEFAAHARAAALEIDALVAAYMSQVDPQLGWRDLHALGRARRRESPLGDLSVLAERGYVADDPPWLGPAGLSVHDALPPAVRDGTFASLALGVTDAVRRGTLTRDGALERVRGALAAFARPTAIDGLERGRLIGPCPACGDWMAGARGRVTCLGCGHWYGLPRQTEALAVPGQTCTACSAPLVVPIIRGRRVDARCPDALGCPTRLGVGVGT